MAVSGYLRSLITTKLSRVSRHLSDAGLTAAVVVWRAKLEKVVEVSVHVRGDQHLHAVGGGPTWQFASTMAAERLDQQTSRLKGKWKDRRRR
jgi:ribosome-associated translation inhibitor RaiA